jgi:hypothetical protein
MKHIPSICMFVIGLIATVMVITVTLFPAPGDPNAMGLMIGAVMAFFVGVLRIAVED